MDDKDCVNIKYWIVDQTIGLAQERGLCNFD